MICQQTLIDQVSVDPTHQVISNMLRFFFYYRGEATSYECT